MTTEIRAAEDPGSQAIVDVGDAADRVVAEIRAAGGDAVASKGDVADWQYGEQQDHHDRAARRADSDYWRAATGHDELSDSVRRVERSTRGQVLSAERVPFDVTHEVDSDYCVGLLHFDTPDEYARYAEGVIRYETAQTVSNAREVVFFAIGFETTAPSTAACRRSRQPAARSPSWIRWRSPFNAPAPPPRPAAMPSTPATAS